MVAQTRKSDGWSGMRWVAVLVGAAAIAAAGLATAVAQDEPRIAPRGRHVRELETYLPQVEIYAPIVDRHLAVFPVRLRDGQPLRGRWLSMDAALSRGLLMVTEKGAGGQVPVVLVENRSRDEHVLILAGELLAGGKQTRTVRQDVALAPGQRLELPVFCVEAHRWEGGGEFSSGKTLLPQSIQAELRRGADQHRIWSEVARNNAALGAENATGSLERALNAPTVRSQLSEVRRKIEPEVPADSVGFLFVAHGRAVGADFFGRTDLARALLPKLLDAYSVDVIILKGAAAGGSDRGGSQPAAVEFFERIRRAGSQRVPTRGSGGGLGTRAEGLLGEGVGLDDALVHYGVQSERHIIPIPMPGPRPRPMED